MTRSVDPPSRWSKCRRGERPDLVVLGVVAPDGVEQLGEGADDPARDERLVRLVEVAAGHVLVEVVGEEQHRPAQGRELVHDRRIVGDQEVDGEQQVVGLDRRGGTCRRGRRRVDDPVAQGLGHDERLADEGVHPDEAHGVALDAQRVERLDVDPRQVVRGRPGAVAAEGRGEQDHRLADGLRERRGDGGQGRVAVPEVEHRVHARDAGRLHVRLGDPEGLRVDRDVGLGADRRPGVVLVHAAVRVRGARLADPAVANGLERPDRVPQLDDRDVGVVDPVDHRLEVVDHDRVHAREPPRQPQAVADRAAGDDPGLEQREQLELLVQAALHHPVVDELEVAAEVRARVRAEQDPPAVAPGEDPQHPEQERKRGDPDERHQLADQARPRDRARQRLLVGLLDRRVEHDHDREDAGPPRDRGDGVERPALPDGERHGQRGRAGDGVTREPDGRRPAAGPDRDQLPAAGAQRLALGPLHDVETQGRGLVVDVPPRDRHRAPAGRVAQAEGGGVERGVGGSDPEQHTDAAPAHRDQLEVRDAGGGPADEGLRDHAGYR